MVDNKLVIFIVFCVVIVFVAASNETYIIPEMQNVLGFNIVEDADKANNKTDYMVTCANINNVVPSPNFSFKYGPTQMNCSQYNFWCPASKDSPNRVSIISPANQALICSYPAK